MDSTGYKRWSIIRNPKEDVRLGMGRLGLSLVNHHSTEELWAAYAASRCAVTQRHLQLIALVSEGRKKAEVLATTRYSDPTYTRLIHRYNTRGLAALEDGRHHNPGVPRLVDKAQVKDLAAQVRSEYDQGILWDGKKMKTWLEETLGREVHPGRAFELLKQVGFSMQRPRPQHVQADPDVQDNFKKIRSHKPS